MSVNVGAQPPALPMTNPMVEWLGLRHYPGLGVVHELGDGRDDGLGQRAAPTTREIVGR